MILRPPTVSITTYLEKLGTIYGSMDRAYEAVSALYGFTCRGCGDNCCNTYFFHYTIVETLYLLHGFRTLEEGLREEVMERAIYMGDPLNRESYLCPLNQGGRCLLYPYRTMICRLHGLPFEVHRPEGQRDEGPGCGQFEKERPLRGVPYRRIDRTPFYTALANLEKEIRTELGYSQRFKKTIADMIREGGGEESLPGILEGLAK